jgi:hypothetical protein
MPDTARESEHDDLEAAAEAIGEHDDERAAVRILIMSYRYLEAARNRAIEMMSLCYARGRVASPHRLEFKDFVKTSSSDRPFLWLSVAERAKQPVAFLTSCSTVRWPREFSHR